MNVMLTGLCPSPIGMGEVLTLGRAEYTLLESNNSPEEKRFQVKRLVWAQQSDEPEKIIVVEEIEWDNKRPELRLGCYTTSKTGH